MKKKIVTILLVMVMASSTNIATLPASAKTNTTETTIQETNWQEELLCEKSYEDDEKVQVQLSEADEKDAYEAASQNNPQKVSLNKVKLKDNKAVLSWKKQGDVSGYEVYMSKTEHGTYKKIKTITSASTTTYTTGVLANNTVSYFKVRAYKNSNGKKVYGVYSGIRSIARGKVEVKTPKLKSATIKDKKAVLTWMRQDSVSGYVVYMAKSKNGPYKAIKGIKKNATTSYKTGILAEGVTYYFKIRPYKNVSGKRVYGDYSGVKTVKREKEVKDYKTIYKEFLEKAKTSYTYESDGKTYTSKANTFQILHLNEDNIPELIVSDTEAHSSGIYYTIRVYTISKNKLVYCGEATWRGLGLRYNNKYRAIKTDGWTNFIGASYSILWKLEGNVFDTYKYHYGIYTDYGMEYSIGKSYETMEKVSESVANTFGETYFNKADIVEKDLLENSESVRNEILK